MTDQMLSAFQVCLYVYVIQGQGSLNFYQQDLKKKNIDKKLIL
jgi:hypothetical protein